MKIDQLSLIGSNIRSNIRKFGRYVEKHSLLIKHRERRRGVGRTLLAWTFVGYTAVTFTYALQALGIPGPLALFFQSLATLSFPIVKCLFDDGFSVLKVIERLTVTPEHLTVSQRRWSIAARSTLGIISGALFEYSKVFSSIVDNSEIFGADAVVVALIMGFGLKQKIGIRWVWILIAFSGIVVTVYADIHSQKWYTDILGSISAGLSVILLGVVLLMTSYMVHHDKPITIAFYQCLAAVVYSSLYLVGSLIYLYLTGDYEAINHYLSFFQISTFTSKAFLALCSGGFLYGWALLLFFQSLYYTEVLILATLGYFLSPVVAAFEWIIYGTPIVLKEMLNAVLITIGTGGLYWHEKKSKEKEEVFIVPAAESLQENLFLTISDYKDGHLSKYHYLSYMYEFEKLIYSFPDLTQQTNIESIKINKNKEVVFELEFPKMIIRDDGSFRCPTFEILNFGDYEPEIAALLYPILKDGDVILDIGAGIGWYSLNFAKRFPQSVIYAFEPIKDLFQILTVNVDNNNVNNIQIFNYGIANKKGTQDFYYLRNQHEYLRNILQPMEQKCQVRTLQDFVNDLNINRLDLIKQELKVKEDAFLLEGKDVVNQYKPLIMFSLREYWDKELIEIFEKDIEILEKIGYRKVIIGESIKKNLTREKHYFFYHPSKHKNININTALENKLIQ